jgi:hypothetical protein
MDKSTRWKLLDEVNRLILLALEAKIDYVLTDKLRDFEKGIREIEFTIEDRPSVPDGGRPWD